MCGRYVIHSTLHQIEKRYGVTTPHPEQYKPNPNVAVGEPAPVITQDQPRTLQFFHFGLTPFWAKKKLYILNARSEGNANPDNRPDYTGGFGILKKPAFRMPIRRQRCLVIADAFIEGPKDLGLARPYLFFPAYRQEPFSMAGIWDQWTDPSTGEIYHSFAIITTPANALVRQMGHHRAPCILHPDDESTWLNPNAPISEITALLRPFDPDEFNAYPIAPTIKNPRCKDWKALQPQGPPLKPQTHFHVQHTLRLLGMGQSPARDRHNHST